MDQLLPEVKKKEDIKIEQDVTMDQEDTSEFEEDIKLEDEDISKEEEVLSFELPDDPFAVQPQKTSENEVESEARGKSSAASLKCSEDSQTRFVSYVKRASPISHIERELLTDLVAQEKILLNRSTDGRIVQLKRQAWARVAAKFNAAGYGEPRAALKIQKMWERLKAKAKREHAFQRRQLRKTGRGGPSRSMPREDAKVLSIIGSEGDDLGHNFDSDAHDSVESIVGEIPELHGKEDYIIFTDDDTEEPTTQDIPAASPTCPTFTSLSHDIVSVAASIPSSLQERKVRRGRFEPPQEKRSAKPAEDRTEIRKCQLEILCLQRHQEQLRLKMTEEEVELKRQEMVLKKQEMVLKREEMELKRAIFQQQLQEAKYKTELIRLQVEEKKKATVTWL